MMTEPSAETFSRFFGAGPESVLARLLISGLEQICIVGGWMPHKS